MHEERYGYRDADQNLELVTIRVTATVASTDVQLAAATGGEPRRARRFARLGGEEVELEVVRGDLSPGTEISGPAVVELPESTLLVPADWSGTVDGQGTIDLKRMHP